MKQWNRLTRRELIALTLPLLAAGACEDNASPSGSATTSGGAEEPKALTVYSGRSKSMVDGLFDAFAKAKGVKVDVRYGETAALANQIIEEGSASPADLYFAQDAGGLGALAKKGLCVALPASILERVDPRFRGADGSWVGTSGRARVVAFNTDKLKAEDLPTSLDGFTDAKWKGRIGWLPTNASFQAYVTALRGAKGDAATEAWLSGVRQNEPKEYTKNGAAVQAVAKGEVDAALVNHYYLHRLKKEAGAAPFPAENFYPPGDLGAMMNVAGASVLKTSKAPKWAEQLVTFLLEEAAQKVFAHENFEYPLAGGVEVASGVKALATLDLPKVDLASLDDLEATLALMRKAKVLP